MNTKIIILGLKVAILTIILFVCYSVASISAGIDFSQTAGLSVISALLIVCTLQTIVLSYPIIRSRWTGWKLVLTIFFVFFGVTTFLSQIETVVFLRYLMDVVPAEIIPRLFVQGAVVAGLFSPVAVLIHGKMKSIEELHSPNNLVMPLSEWMWKLILIAVIYVVIYFSFGMLVFMPLAGEAFQEFYGNLQLPVWILPFQMVRGVIFGLIAIPVIRMMNSERVQLAVALLFSVLMGSLLLLPNPFMPETIRMAHFVEVTTSNFLFGWLVARILSR